MKSHKCETMVSNLSVYVDEDYPCWVVEYNYGSYAAKVPDRIIDIQYCPFCGLRLPEVDYV